MPLAGPGQQAERPVLHPGGRHPPVPDAPVFPTQRVFRDVRPAKARLAGYAPAQDPENPAAPAARAHHDCPAEQLPASWGSEFAGGRAPAPGRTGRSHRGRRPSGRRAAARCGGERQPGRSRLRAHAIGLGGDHWKHRDDHAPARSGCGHRRGRWCGQHATAPRSLFRADPGRARPARPRGESRGAGQGGANRRQLLPRPV